MRSARALALALTLAAGTAPPVPASAAAPVAEADAPRPLRADLRVDAGVLGAAGAVWLGGELLQDRLAPVECRFCGTNALDAWARRQLLLADDRPPRVASDVLTIAIIPAGVIAHQLLASRAAGDAGAGVHDLLY